MLQEIEGHIGIGLVGEKHGQCIRFVFDHDSKKIKIQGSKGELVRIRRCRKWMSQNYLYSVVSKSKEDALTDILEKQVKPADAITGILFYRNGTFIQL